MGWQDILKSEEEGRDKLVDEYVNNVHFFDPNIKINHIAEKFRVITPERLKPLVRTLEFMRPIKDDIDFIGLGKRTVLYSFEVFGERCTISQRLNGLGDISDDNYIQVGDKNVCVKATSDMTNGDFLTTLVYAVKNNVVPDIIKFVAFATYTGHEYSVDSYVYDTSEKKYKRSFLIQLYKERRLPDSFYEELPIYRIKELDINGLNFWLAKAIEPKEILGRW
jgi:hypothetical protein